MADIGNGVDRLIRDACSRVSNEKQEQSRRLAERREAVLERIKLAVLCQSIDDDEVVFSAVHRAQGLRISQAEALASLIEIGVWNETPYWWDVRGVWSGYTRPGRKRIKLFVSDRGSDFHLADLGSSPDPGYFHMELSIRQICSGGWVTILFPPKHKPIFREGEYPYLAATKAYLAYMKKRNDNDVIQIPFDTISGKLKNLIDKAEVSPP